MRATVHLLQSPFYVIINHFIDIFSTFSCRTNATHSKLTQPNCSCSRTQIVIELVTFSECVSYTTCSTLQSLHFSSPPAVHPKIASTKLLITQFISIQSASRSNHNQATCGFCWGRSMPNKESQELRIIILLLVDKQTFISIYTIWEF